MSINIFYAFVVQKRHVLNDHNHHSRYGPEEKMVFHAWSLSWHLLNTISTMKLLLCVSALIYLCSSTKISHSVRAKGLTLQPGMRIHWIMCRKANTPAKISPYNASDANAIMFHVGKRLNQFIFIMKVLKNYCILPVIFCLGNFLLHLLSDTHLQEPFF